MNIAILGLTATSYGSLTYLKNFLPHLAQLDRSNHYDLFLPAAHAGELDVRQANFRIHSHRWAPKSGTLRVLWEQLTLPWILRARRVDAIYTTHNMAILLSSTPSIILIQNVEPFFAGHFPNALHLRPRLWLLRMMTELSLRRAHRIIALSTWEKEFLVARFHLPPHKIIVTSPGVTGGFHPPAAGSAALLREHLGLEPPYILSVTRLAGYGNLLNLAKAYAALVKAGKVTMPLVIPGGVWDAQYMGRVKKLLTVEGCADRVKFLGYVPHQHMPLLFGHATCFVFPSLLEACGTVLIEALACGAPILCCRRRPMSDICGDAAVLFDGEDPNDIADRMFEVLSDAPLREALSRRAVARATQFSWQQGAEKVYRVFEQLALAPGAASRMSATIPPERRT
jgi:glycosyltransferase involved in cell wall biosynthesis